MSARDDYPDLVSLIEHNSIDNHGHTSSEAARALAEIDRLRAVHVELDRILSFVKTSLTTPSPSVVPA
jgi:hypothetical protein